MSVTADLRNGAKTILDTVPAIVQTYSARPGSIGSTPAAWVDQVRVDLTHDAGTRQWSAEADVLVVCGGFDNEEQQSNADTILDAVVDAFSDAPHMAGANTVSEPVRVRSTTVDNGNGIVYAAWIVTIGRFVFAEGR